MPPGCIVKVGASTGGESTPVPTTSTKEEKVKDKKEEWESIVISIEYEVTTPSVGIIVVGPDEANSSVSCSFTRLSVKLPPLMCRPLVRGTIALPARLHLDSRYRCSDLAALFGLIVGSMHMGPRIHRTSSPVLYCFGCYAGDDDGRRRGGDYGGRMAN